MKLTTVLKLLSKPKLLLKIKNSKSGDSGSDFVKSYSDLMKGRKPTADFYDAEMLNLVWETTPEAIATLLPPPLKPPSRPLVFAFIAYYPGTSFSVPYHESALLMKAGYKGEGGFYCLSVPVSDDMAMARGREG